MGNSASARVADGEQHVEVTATEDSVVYLSEDLQAKIVGDFQSKNLKDEWESRQRSILAASNERVARDEQRRAELDQKLGVWRSQNESTQSQLDTKIDGLNSRFADLSVEIQHDASRIERKIGANPKFGRGDICLNARAQVSACLKECDNIRKCDGFVDILENCAKKAVTNH